MRNVKGYVIIWLLTNILFGISFFSDEEEADGEELFGDNMEQDYRPMPGLDRYDPDMLDDDPDNDLG